MRYPALAATLALLWSATAVAETFVVNSDGSGDFPTIQAAIDGCADGDVVALSAGTFVGIGNRDLDYSGKAITIQSVDDDPALCVIDCQGSDIEPHRGFLFRTGEGSGSVLRGITVTGGVMLGDGGAILCQGTTAPSIQNCVLEDNFAWVGGGVACTDAASPLIEDCTVSSNSVFEAGFGGGIACTGSSTPTILRSTISSNTADEFFGGGAGGGIYATAPALISECLVVGNTAYGNSGGVGGGIFAGSNTTIERCVVTDNDANFGGGIWGSPLVRESVITANTAIPGYGGGIGGTPVLVGSTIAGNKALSIGGGLYTEGTVEMERTILWDNCVAFPGEGGEDAWVHGSGELVLTCSDVDTSRVGGTGSIVLVSDNIFVDPLFCDPADCGWPGGDYTLHEGSMCLPGSSPCGQLIGALGRGCGGSIPVEETTWSRVKNRFK